MDVSTVKAEIKAWERAFRSDHQRDATVDDIRKNSAIAEKYKLYKKLLKAPSNNQQSAKRESTSSALHPPSTPPRKSSKPNQGKNQTSLNSLFAETRKPETTAPLTSFNPFSPQKNKGKQPQTPAKTIKKASSPFKRKADSKNTDPFASSIQPLASTSSTTVSHELSRARKRLRGEPVSPSPNKGKRQRIHSQGSLPFKSLLGAPDETSSEDEEDDFESSFLSNSPVKAPEGGKSFKLLFGEDSAGPTTSELRTNSSSTRTQPKSTSRRLFGISEVSHLSRTKEKDALKGSRPRSNTSDNELSKPMAHMDVGRPPKRSLPDSDSERPDSGNPAALGPVLVPPSPPPQDSTFDRGKKSEGKYNKGKKTGSRKKIKKDVANLEADDDLSSESSSEMAVKIVDQKYWSSQMHKAAAGASNGDDDDDPDFDLDPIFTYSRHAAPRGRHSPAASDHELDGTFEVDLPDKLRSVLAIQPANYKGREVREERLVKGLVMGHRVENYDPKKGGEIWDVGEDDVDLDGSTVRKDAEGEDDWEGEPIPWEVGEL